jgi:hypothetical protein
MSAKRVDRVAQCKAEHVSALLALAAEDGISGPVRGDLLFPYYLEVCHLAGLQPLAQHVVLGELGKKLGKKRLRVGSRQYTHYIFPKRRTRNGKLD